MIEQRALVVEVDPVTEPELLGFLRGRGYQGLAVSSTGEALQALADGSFGSTLVDLSKPAPAEAGLIQCLRLRGPSSGPIIAITNGHDAAVDSALLEVEAVLHKPLSFLQLQQVIESLLRPPAGTHGSALEQSDGRIRQETNLWRSPKMMEARQILREGAAVQVPGLV